MSDFQQRSPRPDINPMEQTPPAASQKRSGRHAQQVYCHYCCNQWQQKPKVRKLLSTRNLASFSFDLDAVTAPRKRPRY
ncbi:hypothetical protein B0T13DRAFT_491808 [Neurospora crassa]|nr:hypothetical protein B0T13DRAFT_491808 [Neurospora crassa]